MNRSIELYFNLLSVLIYYYIVGAQATELKCKANLTSLKNEPINITNITMPFISKCCGENEIVFYNTVNKSTVATCTNVDRLKYLNLPLSYSLNIYKPNVEINPVVSDITFSDIKKVQNRNLINSKCGFLWIAHDKKYLLEDGRFKSFKKGSKWMVKDPESYCVDRVIYKFGNKSRSGYVYFVARNVFPQIILNNDFVAPGMIISSIFMLLVLVVHFMLPNLQKLGGMLLMAHVGTLLLVYLTKIYFLLGSGMNDKICENVYSPLFYFLFLSSMLWLNTMSFDIWRSFRRMKLLRDEERKIQLAKFGLYAIYAWGVALGMTIFVIVIDKTDFSTSPNFVKPSLSSCFLATDSNLRYLYAPTGISSMVNIVFFGLTTYNLCAMTHSFNKKFSKTSKSTTNNKSRFRLYLKISLITGFSWVIEVVQAFFESDQMATWVYYVINAYNVFIGVIIFLVFILNRETMTNICKKYNIKWKYYQESKTNTSIKSTYVSRTRSTTKDSTYSKTRGIDETDTKIDSEVFTTSGAP